MRMKCTHKEEEVLHFHREPEVNTYLPRQPDNYSEHKREHLSVYLISEVTTESVVKQPRGKLKMWFARSHIHSVSLLE